MTIPIIPCSAARQYCFVSCGHDINSIHLALYSGSETLIASGTATQSAAGYYYAILHSPGVAGFYKGKWTALYGTDQAGTAAAWVETFTIQTVLEEVD